MQVMDKVKSVASNIANAYKSGDQQSNSLPGELKTAGESMRQGAAAIKGTAVEPEKGIDAVHPSTPAPIDKVNKGREYGDTEGQKRGEKKIDTTDMTKPLGSFKKGTPSVPKTGVYKVHEGEKIVPASENHMSEHSPSEKAHFHRAMSHLNKGALHRHFGIAEGEPIPMEKKQEAANSDNPHVAAMGRMAVAMHGWKHGKK